jgi:2',3'-cyclic-nucleotide 2'-phosphodiesterase/3'-nucleotidase
MVQTVQIFATTDLHGAFDSLAQSQTVKTLKDDFPESIWIDNGDFFIGNALTTYYNTTFEWSPLATQANAFGYDVMVPGNHDLDYGLDFLKAQVAKLSMPYVCCNLMDLNDEYIFDPYTILERNKQKIAVIGLMTEVLPQLTAFENTKNLVCKQVDTSLERVLNDLPSDIDLIVVAYHGGLEVDLESKKSLHYKNTENQAYSIARHFPQIDGLIAGHQHFTNAGKIEDCAFIQPGSHGRIVGSLTFQQTDQGWESQSKNYVIETTPQIKDPAFEEWLQEEINIDSIINFLSEHFEIPKAHIRFQMNGNTRQDFFNAFSIPFSFLKYTFLKKEWAAIAPAEQVDANQESITIYTNDSTLPQHRLMEAYIDNLFNLYHHYLVT